MRFVFVQQSEDEPEQLARRQDEGTAMLEADGFPILTLIEGLIVRRIEADAIGDLDEIVAQITIAGFGHAPGLALKLAGFDTRPPHTGEAGEGSLTLMNGAGLAIRRGHEPLGIALERAGKIKESQ
jgi:hypothetical protein